MRILITAGPTREFFDSVRYISNASSGKMGFALAAEAARRGHEVVLVAGPVELVSPRGVRTIQVVSAKEMFEASVEAFRSCDAAIMAAAVCDYTPARRSRRKLKKSDQPLVMSLVPTRDICAHLGRIKKDRVVVGFALEDHRGRAKAEAKLRRKNCDAIVLNGPGNVGSNRASVELLVAGVGWAGRGSGSKRQVASAIVRATEALVSFRVTKLPR